MRREKWFVSLLICVLAMCFMSVTAFAADTAKVAEVNGKQYDTLAGALAEAKASDTVKLLTDVTESVEITQDITLNLGGHTLTSPSTAGNAVVIVNSDVIIEDGNLTGGLRCVVEIKSGTQQQLTLKGVTVTSANGAGGIWDFGTKSSVTLTDCDVSGDWFAITHNGKTAGFTLTATNSTITAIEGSVPGAAAIYVSGNSTNTAEDMHGMNTISLTGCTVTGPTGIEGKYTNMSLIDCDITATVDIDYSQNSNGSTGLGFAVVSTDNSINGTTPSPQSSITINGGSYTGAIGLSQFEDYKDNENFKEATYVVTSGTFSGDVSDYLAEDADNVEYNTVLKAPTCTVNGIGKRITIVDGETTTSYYVLPAAHKADEAVKENEKEASCTESGSYSSVVYCSVCNEKLSSETVNIPAKGHTEPEKGVTVTAATCAKDGSKSYTCVVCKENVTEVIPATGNHSWEDIKYIEPTCTENGKADGQVCSVCGTVNPDNMPIDLGEVAPATGHKWILNEEAEDYQAATCVTDGVGTYTCSVCHETKTETIPATGKHTEEVVAAKAADCGNAGCTDGVKCSVCGEILFGCEEIPATGEHTEEVVPGKAPTCKDTGLTEGKKCSVCGEVLVAQEVIPVAPDAHTYEVTVLKAATCTSTGVGKFVCTACSTYKYATIPVTHNWDDGKVTTAATCTEDGVKTYTCTSCSETKTEIIPAAGHAWNEGEMTAEPTCGKDGEKTYTCSVCSETKTEAIPATGEHAYEEGAIDATCTEPIMVGEICKVCGQIKGELIPVGEPAGHKYAEEVTKEATCVEDGEKTYTCSVCDDSYTEIIPATGKHTEKYVAAEDSTCVDVGYTEGLRCSVCNEILFGCEEIPATGEHTEEVVPGKAPTCKDIGYTEGKKCSVCGEVLVAQEEIPVDPDAHTYELSATLKAATCTTTGIGKYVCTECGAYKYTTIPAAHSWNEGSVTIEATCGEDGEKTYTCTVEGCGATKTEVIPATGEHNYQEKVVEATCTANTKVGFVCSVCGAVDPDRETVEIPDTMIPHDYEEVVVAATCTEDGSITKTCKLCGDEVVEVLPAIGHKAGEPEYIDATCTENGKEVVKCSVCGEILEENDLGELDPATGHTEEIIPAVPATCGATGMTEGVKCSVCGEILVAQEEIAIDENAHKYEVIALKEATCSATGIGKYTCSICGDYYYGIIEKTEHSFNDEDSEVIKEPTCIETGILIVKCSVCNATEERPIEALGHDWSEEMTSEDSTYVYKECTRCHETEIIAWLGCEHETTELQNAKEATCTEAGYTGDEICTKCGETVKTGEEIPALGHTSAEAVRENEVAATCTEAGSYDEVVYCSVCGEEISRETKNVEAAGHTEEIVEGKAATCTEAGLTEGKKCSVCGETLVAQEEIPALGHTEVTDEAVEASCGSSGKTEGSHCSECGEIIVAQEIVPATGRHAYESVINGDGSITYTCPDCGDTFTEAAA